MIKISYDIAFLTAMDAANASMRKGGRREWDWEHDRATFARVFHRLWPCPKDVEGFMKELVLYGKRKDRTEDWHEEILLTNATAETIERVKVLATKDGFESFRVAEIDLGVAPDFTKAIQ